MPGPITGQPATAAPGLPVWTFQASDYPDPDDGKFSSNAANWNDISALKFSAVSKGNSGASLTGMFLATAPEATDLLLTSLTTGRTTMLHGSGYSGIQVFCNFAQGYNGAIAGDYAVSFLCKAAILKVNGERGDGTSGEVTINVAKVQLASGITPFTDGVYTFDATTPGSVTSITIEKGIVTGVAVLT